MSAKNRRPGYQGLGRPTRHADAIEAHVDGRRRPWSTFGAGSGSYEPTDLEVVPVEPSETMIRLRRFVASPALLGTAEELPLPTKSVDAALADLSAHHWLTGRGGSRDPSRGTKARRVLHT